MDLENKMKKKDVILIGSILLFALIAYGLLTFIQKNSTKEAVVVITVKEKVQGTYSLDKNQTIYIPDKQNATNIIRIQDGKVKMEEADCPDQICVSHRAIQFNNESIVCLPHQVVVEIQNKDDSSIDGGTN